MTVPFSSDHALIFLDGGLNLVGNDESAMALFECHETPELSLAACVARHDPMLQAHLREGRAKARVRISGQQLERSVTLVQGRMAARYAVQYRPAPPSVLLNAPAGLTGSRNELAEALREFPEALAYFDPQGRLVSCNTAYAAYVDAADPDEIIGRTRDDLRAQAERLGARDLDRFERHGLQLAGRDSAGALRKSPNGRTVRRVAIETRSGGTLLLLNDVSDLEQSVRRFDEVLAGSRVAAWTLDPATGKMVLDGDWEGLLGYSKAEIAHFRLDDFLRLVHEDDRPTMLAAREAVARGDLPTFDIERRFLHKDGHYVWVNHRGAVLEYDASGRPAIIAGIDLDVTDRKALERELQERLQALSKIQDGIAITADDGFYTYMNPAHRSMFGIGPDEDLSMLHWSDLYMPEVARQIEEEVLPELLREGAWRGQLIGRHRADRPVPQEVALTLTEHGNMICATRDISDRLADQKSRALLREELLLSQRHEIVHILLEGVAHDLNNLLGSIRHTAELIARGYSDHPPEDAERILRAAEAGAQLVGARLQLATRTRHVRLVDIAETIDEPVQLVRDTAPLDVVFSVSKPETALVLRCDPLDLTQVVLNLLLNARDALCGGRGKIEIALSAASNELLSELRPVVGQIDPARPYAVLQVSDNGRGMDAEQCAKLFDFGFSTKAKEGRGLGMMVVSETVLTLGGAIDLDSTCGKGTRFSLYLPVLE